jgi:hypothetical protein
LGATGVAGATGPTGSSGGTVMPGSVDFHAPSVLSAWTNMPAAETPLFGSSITVANVDLSDATEFRLSAYIAVAGSASAELRVKDDAALADLASVAGAGDVAINSTGLRVGAWTAIRVASRIENARLIVMGVGGNATADPSIGHVRMEYR